MFRIRGMSSGSVSQLPDVLQRWIVTSFSCVEKAECPAKVKYGVLLNYQRLEKANRLKKGWRFAKIDLSQNRDKTAFNVVQGVSRAAGHIPVPATICLRFELPKLKCLVPVRVSRFGKALMYPRSKNTNRWKVVSHR